MIVAGGCKFKMVSFSPTQTWMTVIPSRKLKSVSSCDP
jgi:hypothetical protein